MNIKQVLLKRHPFLEFNLPFEPIHEFLMKNIIYLARREKVWKTN